MALSLVSGLMLASSVRKEQRRYEKAGFLEERLDSLERSLDAIDLLLIETP